MTRDSARVSAARVTRRRPAIYAAPWRRGVPAMRRRLLRSDAAIVAVLAVVTVALVAAHARSHQWAPPGTLVVVLLVGGFLLGVRALLALYVVVAAGLMWMALRSPGDFVPGAVLVVTATGVIVLLFTRTRARLGVQGTRGESMLVDLRDRLRAQGEMPPLPAGWHAEVELRSAYGASFSGDFLVSTLSTDGRILETVLVDVSGKGVDAGTRALLLSGAFGGLLGAMPPPQFLPAANAYLIRQRWEEGFATAAHLTIDVTTGDYAVVLAGHPPPAQFHAGSGRWRLVDPVEGPLLGILPDATYAQQTGRLGPGDALMLYTDGVVETPGRDLVVGIDRLLGQAERLVTGGFRRGARLLVDRVATGESDDRALVLIWRS